MPNDVISMTASADEATVDEAPTEGPNYAARLELSRAARATKLEAEKRWLTGELSRLRAKAVGN